MTQAEDLGRPAVSGLVPTRRLRSFGSVKANDFAVQDKAHCGLAGGFRPRPAVHLPYGVLEISQIPACYYYL